MPTEANCCSNSLDNASVLQLLTQLCLSPSADVVPGENYSSLSNAGQKKPPNCCIQRLVQGSRTLIGRGSWGHRLPLQPIPQVQGAGQSRAGWKGIPAETMPSIPLEARLLPALGQVFHSSVHLHHASLGSISHSSLFFVAIP